MRRERAVHRPAQRPHPEVERGGPAVHVSPARRPRQRHVLRPRRQSDRLRRRKDRPVVHRAGRHGHGAARHVRRQTLERPQRCLGTAGRRALLHRSVLSADLVDTRRDAPGRAARLLPVRRPPAPRAGDHGPDKAQRHHRHAGRQELVRVGHRREQDLPLRHRA